jgi:eukaryotic-like serine/threonine-protein kinase
LPRGGGGGLCYIRRVSVSGESIDAELKQIRLAKFGLVLGGVTLGYVALNACISLWLGRASFNLNSLPLLVAGVAFAALWWLLRGPQRSSRFVRVVEIAALTLGTTALSSVALVLDLTSSPDMIARSTVTYLLLVYAVYVPSTARHTLVVAALMSVPLLGCIFLAFREWDPALYDPPAAVWKKGNKGDMAYIATFVSAFLWSVVVAIAVGFSHTIYGLRRAVNAAQKLGQYTLEEQLGEGGMGVVYRASHAMLRRPTAVKLLPAERAGVAAVARFEREVQRTAALTHPNTVTIFDYGRTTEGVFYYAMELLDGLSLDQLVELDGAQPEDRVIHLLEQASASLAEAHEAGLIHRDIKPGNIMLVARGGIPDWVKVLDFGLVKDLGSKAGDAAPPELSLTAGNVITGTPLYMAPEAILAADTVDASADVYALGAVGYWLLTGTHVFGGSTIVEVCAHHLHSTPESPSVRLRADVSQDLETLILDCLAKGPSQRPTNARALNERLKACAGARRWSSEQASAWWRSYRAKGPHQADVEASSRERPAVAVVTRAV